MIADQYRMHALCNEIGPLGVGLLALRLKPDIVTGAVRYYVRDAIEDRSNEHQRQERPDFLHEPIRCPLYYKPLRPAERSASCWQNNCGRDPRVEAGCHLRMAPLFSTPGALQVRYYRSWLALACYGSVISSQFDFGLLDELAPFFRFIDNNFVEIRGRARKNGATQAYKM
jgi:hypothetical protein